jgi:hypothetical protein
MVTTLFGSLLTGSPSAHFLPVKSSYTVAKYAEHYLTKIVCLHGVPKTIISDRGPQFSAHFWESLHDAMGTTLTFGTAYHPRTDGQTERVNQILEDILELVQLFMARIGKLACHLLNFPITIAIKQVLGCHLLKHCMAKVVEPL